MAARDDGEAGVAWDWVQISGDVVAMADPMSVVTNLRLVGQEGAVLTALESARYLNEIVHALALAERSAARLARRIRLLNAAPRRGRPRGFNSARRGATMRAT